MWLTAQQQTIPGLFFDGMASLPASLKPERKVVLQMSAQTAAIESRNKRIDQVLVEVAKIYDSLQLPYLLLKGPAVAAAYRNPLHRTGGDLDFFLAPDDCRKAQETLFGDTTLASSTARHYSGKLHGVHIENHFRLAHSSLKRYRDFERELLSDRIRLPLHELDMDGYPVKCPSPTFQALFMLEHMAFHLPTGLGLRQLCDWARYLSFYSDRIDRTEAAGIIHKYGFERIAILFTILCIDYLGMAPGHALLSVERDKGTERDIAYVLGLILHGGNFGRNYDALHSSRKHQRLPTLLRKPITFAVLLRNRRKYDLIAPDLWRKTVWDSIVRHL
ncbi:nucleotidyltransferase family protein [Alistipes sp.]|uniref:nucleotidyltransferase family protein n=1 Tax=Alistipes sp. TaxID=1872444 RepID=UPI003AEFBB57